MQSAYLVPERHPGIYKVMKLELSPDQHGGHPHAQFLTRFNLRMA